MSSWGHLTDAELAKEIRERVAEMNELVTEAHGRDIIAAFEVLNTYPQRADTSSQQVLTVTTSQRI